MVIQGLKNFSLLDYPGKTACTIYTAGCNFRCPYCYNTSLVIDTYKNKEIPLEEVYGFLKSHQGILEGICLTGGEPLIQHGIEEFMDGVKEMGYLIRLETNGSFPDKLRKLGQAGLIDYVAMDIKNSQESYGKTVGIEGYDVGNIHRSAQYLLSGEVDYEFCTTVVLEFHQRSDFESIGRWLRGARRYYLQPFVNSDSVMRSGLHRYNDSIMNQAIEIIQKYIPSARLRG